MGSSLRRPAADLIFAKWAFNIVAGREDKGHLVLQPAGRATRTQLLLFGTPLDAVRDTVHRSDYQVIGEGYDRFGSLARSRPTVEIRDEDCFGSKMLIRVTPLKK